MDKNKEILKLLNKNGRMEISDIAAVTDMSEDEVKERIEKLKADGVICGVKAVIDWEKTEQPFVSAIIELKVTPKGGCGFEEVAAKVSQYSEVESVYLMSGVYDLNVVVKCKTLQDIARFVAKELSTIESVTSTATHFVMRRYKECDLQLIDVNEDDRGAYSL